MRKAKTGTSIISSTQNTAAPMQVLLSARQDVYPDVNVMGLTTRSTKPDSGVAGTVRGRSLRERLQRCSTRSADSDVAGKQIIEDSFGAKTGRWTTRPWPTSTTSVASSTRSWRSKGNAAEVGDMSSGEDFRQGMFEISDWNVRGLAQPFTYEEGDRRPTMSGRVYQVQDGAFEYDTTIDLPRKNDWIGL